MSFLSRRKSFLRHGRPWHGEVTVSMTPDGHGPQPGASGRTSDALYPCLQATRLAFGRGPRGQQSTAASSTVAPSFRTVSTPVMCKSR
jgi:hypothetical protein